MAITASIEAKWVVMAYALVTKGVRVQGAG